MFEKTYAPMSRKINFLSKSNVYIRSSVYILLILLLVFIADASFARIITFPMLAVWLSSLTFGHVLLQSVT